MSTPDYLPTDVCPVCNGTTRMPAFGQWAATVASYDPATHTFACTNCGGQRMFGKPSGRVPLDKAGNPCTHKYAAVDHRNGYTVYLCENCGDIYDIDTGD